MAIVFDGPISPDALTTFIRNVPVESNLALVSLFPTRYFDTNRIDWAEFVKTYLSGTEADYQAAVRKFAEAQKEAAK